MQLMLYTYDSIYIRRSLCLLSYQILLDCSFVRIGYGKAMSDPDIRPTYAMVNAESLTERRGRGRRACN